MARRKRNEPDYDYLSILIDDFEVRAAAGANLELLGILSDYPDEAAPVFEFQTHLQLTGLCVSPEARAGDRYYITMIGDAQSRNVRATIKDLRKLDKYGSPAYKKRKSGLVPIYNDPPPIAFLEKVRGQPRYTVWFAVAPEFVSDCLNLVASRSKPVYAELHEIRENRQRRIRSFSIQTTDPAEG